MPFRRLWMSRSWKCMVGRGRGVLGTDQYSPRSDLIPGLGCRPETTMRDHATPQQIQHYREQGFVVIEDLLTPAEVRELSDAVEEGIARMGARKDEHTR